MRTQTVSGQQVFELSEDCPIRDVVVPLGGKWSALILFVLLDGPQRFGEVQRRIEGISQRMLAQTLRQLEREGFATRTVYPEVPVKVEYALTAMGQSLIKPLWSVVSWARDHHPEIRKARRAYDRRSES